MEIISKFFSDLAHLGLADIGVILAVIVMDAALSGDNSIAINALALDLPERERNKAIWLGMSLAAVLRIVALGLAAFIIRNPWVQILGGLYLIKLCVDHFRKEEEDAEAGHKTRKSLAAVLVAIGFLDLSLSLDNVIAVVAMSQNLAVIVLGVLMSIAMLAVATQLVRKVMKRYPSLEEAAYIILAFLGILMIVEHGSEFVLWIGEKISAGHGTIAHLHFKVGDLGEIAGVAAIIAVAVMIDEIKKRKARALHHAAVTVEAKTE